MEGSGKDGVSGVIRLQHQHDMTERKKGGKGTREDECVRRADLFIYLFIYLVDSNNCSTINTKQRERREGEKERNKHKTLQK